MHSALPRQQARQQQRQRSIIWTSLQCSRCEMELAGRHPLSPPSSRFNCFEVNCLLDPVDDDHDHHPAAPPRSQPVAQSCFWRSRVANGPRRRAAAGVADARRQAELLLSAVIIIIDDCQLRPSLIWCYSSCSAPYSSHFFSPHCHALRGAALEVVYLGRKKSERGRDEAGIFTSL